MPLRGKQEGRNGVGCPVRGSSEGLIVTDGGPGGPAVGLPGAELGVGVGATVGVPVIPGAVQETLAFTIASPVIDPLTITYPVAPLISSF